MGIYEPLSHFLADLPDDCWNASFTEIERIIGRKLPASAYDHRTWWGNRREGNHGHANAWREAGWETRVVDVNHRTVRFERVRGGKASSSRPVRPSLDALWQKAQRLTGISDRDELTEAALNALIRREAARQLIALGGTMPNFVAPPRERPTW